MHYINDVQPYWRLSCCFGIFSRLIREQASSRDNARRRNTMSRSSLNESGLFSHDRYRVESRRTDLSYVSGLGLGQRNPTVVTLWHAARCWRSKFICCSRQNLANASFESGAVAPCSVPGERIEVDLTHGCPRQHSSDVLSLPREGTKEPRNERNPL